MTIFALLITIRERQEKRVQRITVYFISVYFPPFDGEDTKVIRTGGQAKKGVGSS